jgi:hypothetical protein
MVLPFCPAGPWEFHEMIVLPVGHPVGLVVPTIDMLPFFTHA